jgi:hypothetical protein
MDYNLNISKENYIDKHYTSSPTKNTGKTIMKFYRNTAISTIPLR